MMDYPELSVYSPVLAYCRSSCEQLVYIDSYQIGFDFLAFLFACAGIFRWAVAGAECNTVIELTLEHHAA
jgi:hypothetical protein